jgi:hypothetical protein
MPLARAVIRAPGFYCRTGFGFLPSGGGVACGVGFRAESGMQALCTVRSDLAILRKQSRLLIDALALSVAGFVVFPLVAAEWLRGGKESRCCRVQGRSW